MRINSVNKLLSILLVVSISLSITSCAGNQPKEITPNSAETIPDDAPWYNSEVVEFDLGIDESRTLNNLSTNLIGADEEYACIYAEGEYFEDWSTEPVASDFTIRKIVVYDRTTKQNSKTIDLWNILDDGDGYPEDVIYSNGTIIVKCSVWDPETNIYSDRDYYIDPDTETIVDYVDYEEDDLAYCGSYNVGDYRIETRTSYFLKPNEYAALKVFAPDGSETEVSFAAADSGGPEILALDNTTALLIVSKGNKYEYYELNLLTYEITECDSKDYEWLELDQMINICSDAEGAVFYTTDDGISRIDLEKETDEQVLEYSWCGVNRQYLTNAEIAYGSDDSYVLCCQYESTDIFSSPFAKNFAIVELTKAEKNPHAGKTILELYSADGKIDPTISDAIIDYNNTSSDYYIEISDRYDVTDYMKYTGIKSKDDYDSEWLDANASLSDELAIDIINGEGPDIILNASNLGQLNSDNCLVDLYPYVSDLDENEYYTNIIEGAKTGDKLYQLPVSFTIEGIQTDPDYAGASGVGFTTEEYDEFLYDELNGTDVIESGQAMYFVKLFNGMSDVFIKDGKVNLKGPEYAELAEFVKDNVIEESKSWDADDFDPLEMSPEEYNLGKNWKTACYCNCPGISGYLVKRAQITNGTAILGIPSTDGRGPMFGASISVAVSAYAVNVDACVDFVQMLLSEDVQTALALSDKLVLNKDALRDVCSEAVEYFNTEQGSQYIFDYAQGTTVSIPPILSNDDVDSLEEVIESCSGMNTSDAAINIILAEEMPAYFLDQKDLDDVIEIIQDRAQTVLDERG